jgi:hypothetical protein
MQSTKENPLAFFTVYFELGIDNAVINYQTEKSQIQDHVNSLSEQHIPDDIRTLPFKEDEHTTFEEYILINTKPEIKKSKEFIEQGFERRFSQEKEINAYSSFLRKKLNLLCKLPKFKEYPFLSKIIKEFNDFINDFADTNIRYVNLQDTNKIINNPNVHVEKSSSNFYLKGGIKSSFLGKLYDVMIDLDLIDDVETREEDFVEVFSSPKPLNKIQFIKPNLHISFFLKEIEPFFESLNGVTIEKSKCFLNKQGKTITSTDLYTSLSRNKGKDLEYLRKIKNSIDVLKRIYLK